MDGSRYGTGTSLLRVMAGMALFLMLSACTPALYPLKHGITIDSEGRPLVPTTSGFEPDTEFDRHSDEIATAAADHGRILIFVHGGLNMLHTSSRRIKELMDGYFSGHPSEHYPIFVNWDSGFVSTYFEHLTLVRQGKIEPVTGPLTAPFVFVEDTGRAAARAPIAWFRQYETDWKSTTFPNQPYTNGCPDDYAPGLHPEIQSQNALYCVLGKGAQTPGITLSLGSATGEGWYTPHMLGRFFSYWLTVPVKYALVPVIDGYGKPAWDNMVRRTRNMYRTPGEFDLRQTVMETMGDKESVEAAAREAVQREQTGALARLLRQLDRRLEGNTAHEITLIGHSMGTIVLNELLRSHDDYPNLRIRTVVYMAAACSIRDFQGAVIPFMQSERGKEARFFNLTLHPLNDAREADWRKLDLVPRGSLLEWIDNYLTTPDTPLDRTLGKWENIIQATHVIPPEVRSRVNLKAFGVGKTETDGPQRHGEFDDYEPWKGQTWRFWDPLFWKPGVFRWEK
uniref:Lipoprotein n=1 Tax=Geobacter metallireducens TaxID=28232 RepID=A0A831XK10_GEOME